MHKNMQIVVEQEQISMLDKIKKETGFSKSALIRTAINHLYKRTTPETTSILTVLKTLEGS